MPEPTPLNPLKSEAQEIYEYLAEWIDSDGEEGLTEEITGWLGDHDAVRKSEVEPYGVIDEFYVPAGGGIVLLAHGWFQVGEHDPWKRSYTLKLFTATREHSPRPPEPILRLL